MYLHEEYINRHKLDAKVVVYSKRSSVVLKSRNIPIEWYVFAFQWHHFDNHPGYFEVKFSKAIHNSWHGNNCLKPIIEETKWQWDVYEENLLEFTKDISKNLIALEFKEHVLASWCVFLNIYDSWLAQKMDQQFFNLVYKSINPKENFESRLEAQISALRQISSSEIQDVWIHQMLPLARHDSEWLVNLINGW